jgi:hypothetical protein
MDSLVDKVYKDMQKYAHSIVNYTIIEEHEGNQTFGSVIKDDFDKILDNFNQYFNKNTVFYDLGSGLGNIVNHVAIKTSPKKSCGIELSHERYAYSKEFSLTNNIQSIFLEGSFFDFDISDATVIYNDNTMYNAKINKKIYDMIPKGCLYFFRNCAYKFFVKEEVFSISCGTTYGSSSLFYLIKK